MTIPVAVEPPPSHADAEAAYRVEAGASIELFGARRGTVTSENGRLVFPLTFQLAPSAPAGTVEAARVTFRWDAETSLDTIVRVEVPARHHLDGGLTTDVGTVAPGGELTLLFRLVNHGNVRDTIRIRQHRRDPRWTVRPRKTTLALAPGEQEDVPVLVRAPRGASIGQSRQLRLLAEGRGEAVRTDVLLRVVEDEGWLPGLEHLPTEVFLGGSAGGAGDGDLVASIRAEGTVGAETEVSLWGRSRPSSSGVRPFRRDVSGPKFRLDVRRPEGSLALGDVYAHSSPLAGTFRSGRGIDLAYRGEQVFGEIFVAEPGLGTVPDEGGTSVLAAGGVELDEVPDGRAGLTLSDERWTRRSDGAAWTRSAGAHLELAPASDQHVRFEAGLMVVGSDPDRSVRGFAGEAEYSLYGAETSVDGRVRYVPGAVTGGGVRGNEIYLRGRRRLSRKVHVLAHGRWTETPLLDAARNPKVREVGTGARYDTGPLRLEGLLRYRQSAGILPGDGWRRRRTALLAADLPLGPVRLDGSLELGTESTALTDDARFRRLQATARWSRGSSWLWITAGGDRVPGFPSRTYAEVQGGTDLQRLELSGRAALDEGLDDARVRLWTRLGYELTSGLAIVAEMERRPPGPSSAEWSVALGVEKALNLPVPLPSTPVAEGVVYDDRNGNLQRDPGEPGLQGVRVRKGFAEAVTDEQGRFEIRQEAVRGRRLEVAVGTLPTGALVPAGVRYPDDGETAIPVVRTAALHLSVFLDRDEDGRRDDDESAAAGARIILEGRAARRRVVEADDRGRARIGGLRPGVYTVEILLAEEGQRLAVSRTVEVTLEPGESAARDVALPVRNRPVRF